MHKYFFAEEEEETGCYVMYYYVFGLVRLVNIYMQSFSLQVSYFYFQIIHMRDKATLPSQFYDFYKHIFYIKNEQIDKSASL